MSQSLSAGRGRAPELVVLGAPRCGTTSLATYLKDAGLNVGVKDSFYLMDKAAGLRGSTHLDTHGIEGYLSLFRNSSRPTVEVTAGYVFQRTALDFFRSWDRPPNFLLVARDPVERLRSVHRYFAGNLGVLPHGMTFVEYVAALAVGAVDARDKTVSDALRQGRYIEHIAPWVEVFGNERVEVVSFDEFKNRPGEVVDQLLIKVGASSKTRRPSYVHRPQNQSYLSQSKPLNALTAAGRGLVPAGRLRSWAGQTLRQWQSTRPEPNEGASEAPTPTGNQAGQAWLSEYYADSNRVLMQEFGISTGGWI